MSSPPPLTEGLSQLTSSSRPSVGDVRGGRLHGSASDITRTGVFGAPPIERQRLVWDVVRRAQKAAFEAARPGAEAQPLEAVARRVVEEAGFVPGEIGIRHEGCIYITQDGAANMTR